MREFLRSRHLLGGCLCAVLAAAIGAAVHEVRIRTDSALDTSGGSLSAVIVAIAAVTCSGAATTRERAAVRRLGAWRVCVVLVVVAVAAISHALLPGGQPLSYLRAAAGLSGLGLLAAQTAPARLAWVILVLWIAVPPFLFYGAEDDPTRVLTFWAWPVADAVSWVVSAALGGLGLAALAVRSSPR